MCQRAVREWLVLLTMEKYMNKFLERGWDTIAHCQMILAKDLAILGIDNPTHKKLLLDGVQFLNNTTELFKCREPCDVHAQNYVPELDVDISELHQISEADESFKPKLGIEFCFMSAFTSLEETVKSESPTFTFTPLAAGQLIQPSTPPSPNKSKSEIGNDFNFLSEFQLLEKTTIIESSPKSPTMHFLALEASPTEPILAHSANEITVNSLQFDVPSIKVKLGYSCAACPHLKFGNLSELECHMFEGNKVDGDKHKGATPRVESYVTVNDSPMIIVD